MKTIENKRAKEFIKSLIKRAQEDEIVSLSAQLAYFLLLSIFPSIIFGITLLGQFPISSNDILNLLHNVSYIVPQDTYILIKSMVLSVFQMSQKGNALSLSIIMSLWSASNGMKAIIRALNKAYNVKEDRDFLHNRFVSIFLVFSVVMAIIIALLLSVFGNFIGNFIYFYFDLEVHFLRFWDITRYGTSVLLLFILFMLLYCLAPNKKLRCREVYKGTIFAVIGWIIVSYLFSYYVDHFANYSATYGSIGGVIVLMIWLYLSSMILILGGEINATLQWFKKK